MMMLSFFGIAFEIPLVIFLIIPALLAFAFANRDLLLKKKRRKIHLIAIRSATITALFLVLAMPYTVREENIMQEVTSVLIIDDNSDSMAVYRSLNGMDIRESIEAMVGDVSNIGFINLSTRNYTALGDAIYQGILGSSSKMIDIILASDGNNNRGADIIDIAAFAAETNTRIFPVLPAPTKSEVYISTIAGSNRIPVNSKYAGRVVVKKIGKEANYNLRIFIDEEKILDTPVIQSTSAKEFQFEHIFNSKGPHNITARISPDSEDIFSQNNVFSKIVKVVERPRILLVSRAEDSPLRQVLDEFYSVDVRDSMPQILDRYDGIVLDNQPAGSVVYLDELRDSLRNGGGLLVVGGNNSYNDGGYYGSEFENLLPVRSSEAPSKKGEQMNVIILLDISGSTGAIMSGETKIDVEKAIAVKIIRELAKKTHIGIVAFNSDAFVIRSIQKIEDTTALEDRISRLSFGGGTYVLVGLIKARDMLRSVQGSRYIILISDGITNYPAQAFEEASSMGADDLTIHTIGVGFDTDAAFMRGLALRGNGIYFEPTETERIKIIFGELDEGGQEEGRFSMILTDTHHFITRGMGSTNISIHEFNRMTKKSSARVLATTQDMQPLLTVWRFGLGRVVSLAVDDGSEWATSLYTEGNSKLVSSMINWIVGDPDMEEGLHIDCTDTRVGEETPVIISAEAEYPAVSMGGEDISLGRLDEKKYFFTYYPERPGFETVQSDGKSCIMAVNYPEEYSEFEVKRDLLAALANITKGKMYHLDNMAELINDLSRQVRTESTGVETKKINMQLWFTFVAIMLFSIDVIIRRVGEIRKK